MKWIIIGCAVIVVVGIFVYILLNANGSSSSASSAFDQTGSAADMTESERQGFASNVTVLVRESAINDMLNSFGTFEGTKSVGFKSKLTDVQWKITNPRVEIMADSAIFLADLEVKILGSDKKFSAHGNADVIYDSLAKELRLKLHDIRTDLQLSVFGIKINLDALGVIKQIPADILILRNLPIETDFPVKKPTEGKRYIRFEILQHHIRYRPHEVVVDFVLNFRENKELTAEKGGVR